MNDVTRIIEAAEAGDPSASGELLPIVYDELRALAAQRLRHEGPGQTLQATALVHEAYLRLVNCEEAPHWKNRGHFFAAAAEAMRRILLNRARDKKRIKRGGVNGDHIIDAADYAIWRKGLGTLYTQTDYNTWRSHFGQSSGSGSGATADLPSSAVTEPSAFISFVLVAAGLFVFHRNLATSTCRRCELQTPLRH